MAMMASIGAASPEEFIRQGDGQVAVLRHHGLRDGMAIYDLGCGSGRTAMALHRSGWQGDYKGADIIKSLVAYLNEKCPGYEAVVHRKLTIAAPDVSQDMIFHWSVFTHLRPEECYLYMRDSFRALKPGGKLVFSFLEFEDENHRGIFRSQIKWFDRKGWSDTTDTFLHRDWIRFWARDIGFDDVAFTNGIDATHHPGFWQALVAMAKPVSLPLIFSTDSSHNPTCRTASLNSMEKTYVESPYFNLEKNRTGVSAGKHREMIGGLWDSVGALQLEFMISEGLKPKHKLLDIGCGAMRGGVQFVNYLDPQNYYGSDMNQPFLDAGYDIELMQAGLQQKLSRNNLVCNETFELPWPDGLFDYAIAQSVFTHLSLNRIRQCLVRTAPKMKPGGVFYATFFELPKDAASDQPVQHAPAGITTYDVQDPYHYSVSDFAHIIRGLPWHIRYIGDWNHPRGQRLIAFERLDEAQILDGNDERLLSVEEAGSLMPGANHYRAYVGPPDRFDFMSGTQFSLMFQCGLRENHHVLDFGAGSLRLGRLLLPYLRPGRYHAIEPNTWLIREGINHEIGQDAIDLKQPSFSSNDAFDCTVFGRKFDFVMAQSIVTHCAPALFQRLLNSFSDVLEDDGLILFSYCNTTSPIEYPEAKAWIYPACAHYTEDEVQTFIAKAGLVGCSVPWFHPGAKWFLAARSAHRLPNDHEAGLLRGAVLFDPQFAESRAQAAK